MGLNSERLKSNFKPNLYNVMSTGKLGVQQVFFRAQ